MIAYQNVPTVRATLDKKFPSELRYNGDNADEKIIQFIEDILKFGSTTVRKERLFMVGHQGSGKSSLVRSLRLRYFLAKNIHFIFLQFQQGGNFSDRGQGK